jgi:hypothetical protein
VNFKKELSKEIISKLRKITAKRPRTVIEHIIKKGHITTEELKNKYGYNHPPRAARDVREQGIILETFKVKDANGRSIAAYRFGDLTNIDINKTGGRKPIPKLIKTELLHEYGFKCSICLEEFNPTFLQVDHRIPYEIVGDIDAETKKSNDYMLVCGSCNRAKSWSCEHCDNNLKYKNKQKCQTCYWASPEKYEHIACQDIRRIELVWKNKEIDAYEILRKKAENSLLPIQEYTKNILKKSYKKK